MVQKIFCHYCLQHFTTNDILNKHKELCIAQNGTQKIKLPDKNNKKPQKIIHYKFFSKQLPAPFVIYADFECITPPPKKNDVYHGDHTEAYQEQKSSGYGYKIVCYYNEDYNKPTKIYRGPDAANKLTLF